MISQQDSTATSESVAIANPCNELRTVLFKTEAFKRSRQVSNISYSIEFHFTAFNTATYEVHSTVLFDIHPDAIPANEHIFIDCAVNTIFSLEINEVKFSALDIQSIWSQNRLILNPHTLKQSGNQIKLHSQSKFSQDSYSVLCCQDISPFKSLLSQSPQTKYPVTIYCLFPTNNAHRAFCCFDQPNLKARFSLTVQCPSEWTVVGNEFETLVSQTGQQSVWQCE